MPTLLEQRDGLVKEAHNAIAAAKAAGGLTNDDREKVKGLLGQVDDLNGKIDAQKADDDLFARLGDMTPNQDDDPGTQTVKSIGEHFVKAAGDLSRLRERGSVFAAPEFKAATDPHLIGSVFNPVLTEVDRTVVRGYRRPVVIADLLGSGSMSGNAITYFVENPTVEGGFATVAEGAQKPQIHFLDPTTRTDKLSKIAGWWDVSDEMLEDLDFMVSEINQRGMYLLSLAEEAQLLTGDGTGTNVLGMLNRSGIQTETQAATGDNAPDAVFRALMKVQTGTGMVADSIVMNPADYQPIRLSKDANGQYYGGGFFTGPYGQGGIMEQPPLWGVRTILTTAIAPKTFLVGALQPATSVYRKGGVRVESTNSDLGKFTKNVVTFRMEERVALAVRTPAAIVKGTLV